VGLLEWITCTEKNLVEKVDYRATIRVTIEIGCLVSETKALKSLPYFVCNRDDTLTSFFVALVSGSQGRITSLPRQI
jgi:hypothetical protein